MSIEINYLDAKAQYLRARRSLLQGKMMSDMKETNLLVSQVLDIFENAVTEYSKTKNPKIFIFTNILENDFFSIEFLIEDENSGSIEFCTCEGIEKYARANDIKKSAKVDLSLALERAGRKKISQKEWNEFLKVISEYCEVDEDALQIGYFIRLK